MAVFTGVGYGWIRTRINKTVSTEKENRLAPYQTGKTLLSLIALEKVFNP